jgi:hypothetical protein
MPVSRTEKWRTTGGWVWVGIGLGLGDADFDDDLAFGGELDGVADEVDEDLAEAGDIADERGGMASSSW